MKKESHCNQSDFWFPSDWAISLIRSTVLWSRDAISVVYCKTAVSPVYWQWRCCSFPLSHRREDIDLGQQKCPWTESITSVRILHIKNYFHISQGHWFNSDMAKWEYLNIDDTNKDNVSDDPVILNIHVLIGLSSHSHSLIILSSTASFMWLGPPYKTILECMIYNWCALKSKQKYFIALFIVTAIYWHQSRNNTATKFPYPLAILWNHGF